MTRIDRITIPTADRQRRSGKKIVFVLPGLRAGGSEHVVTFVAGRLAAIGHDVTIANFETGAEPPYYETDERVRIHYLGRPVVRQTKVAAAIHILRRISDLRRFFAVQNPDLVISFLTRTNIQVIAATRGLNIPVIVSERNNPVRQDPGPVWKYLRHLAYPKAAGLVTMTRGALECFPKASRKRSWVIPNMSDFSEFAPKVHEGSPALVAVGRLTHQKGFDLLIEAFSKAAAQVPDWKLRIWGDGPDHAELAALVDRLGLADRVEMPGLSARPGQWIETADAFVLSSRFEGWGLVLGEAMAAGLPCASFACPFGPEEMITHEHDGLLAKDCDVDDLAVTLTRLMKDGELRRRLGANAKITSRRFEPQQIGEKWEEAVEQMLRLDRVEIDR